jgi:two-component system uhpT operon response regulator UhpA
MHRIVLIDDHAIVREGFRALIERERDLAIIGECGRCAEAEAAVAALQPDLAVLDLSLPDGGGLALIPKLREAVPDLRVIVLSMHDSEPYLSEALARGADGYVSKGAATSELVVAIRAVMAGNVYLSSDVAARRPQRQRPGVADLSPREREVLALLANGKAPKQIADDLGIRVKTVYVHRANVLDKLGVRNEVELYRMAVEKGLLEG